MAFCHLLQIQINQLKADKFEMKNQVSKLEDEVKMMKGVLSHFLNFGHANSNTPFMPSNVADQSAFLRQNSTNHSPNDSQKRRSVSLKYGTVNQDGDSDPLEPIQQQFTELLKEDNLNYNRNNIAQHAKNDDIYTNTANDNHDCTIVQMEKDNLELRRELQDARASNKQADKKIQE